MNDRPVIQYIAQHIVEDILGIKQEFLLERRNSIITRLSSAAKTINASVIDDLPVYPSPKKDAIDKCLYLAISILFTGSSPGGFNATKSFLSDKLDGIDYDPLDVAAASILWYLLSVFPRIVEKSNIEEKSSEVSEFPKTANDLREIFVKARWFLSDELLVKLGVLPKPHE